MTPGGRVGRGLRKGFWVEHIKTLVDVLSWDLSWQVTGELIFLFLSGPKTMIPPRWEWGFDFRCEGRLQIGSWTFMLQEEVKEKTIGAFLSPQRSTQLRSGGRNQPPREFLFPSGFPFPSPQLWDFFKQLYSYFRGTLAQEIACF